MTNISLILVKLYLHIKFTNANGMMHILGVWFVKRWKKMMVVLKCYVDGRVVMVIFMIECAWFGTPFFFWAKREYWMMVPIARPSYNLPKILHKFLNKKLTLIFGICHHLLVIIYRISVVKIKVGLSTSRLSINYGNTVSFFPPTKFCGRLLDISVYYLY